MPVRSTLSMKNIKPHSTTGFTLIEMAIAIVVVGLIAGAILAGQNLVRNTQINSVLTDLKRYEEAMNIFVQKYNAFPGDMKYATDIWGAAASCVDASPTATTKATCDGNGNSQIDWYYKESRFAWHHMMNAGILTDLKLTAPGNGVQRLSSFAVQIPGFNVPEGKLKGVGYSIWWANGSESNLAATLLNVHVVQSGMQATNSTNGPYLTAAEAYAVDKKVDDGFPAAGSFISNGYTGCHTGAPTMFTHGDTTSTAYDVTDKRKRCSIMKVLDKAD